MSTGHWLGPASAQGDGFGPDRRGPQQSLRAGGLGVLWRLLGLPFGRRTVCTKAACWLRPISCCVSLLFWCHCHARMSPCYFLLWGLYLMVPPPVFFLLFLPVPTWPTPLSPFTQLHRRLVQEVCPNTLTTQKRQAPPLCTLTFQVT